MAAKMQLVLSGLAAWESAPKAALTSDSAKLQEAGTPRQLFSQTPTLEHQVPASESIKLAVRHMGLSGLWESSVRTHFLTINLSSSTGPAKNREMRTESTT